jgi:predicted ATPase
MKKLLIKGFVGIQNAEIVLDGLTVVIGPQASGKSIIARLNYFFCNYFYDLFTISTIKQEKKSIFDKIKKEMFYKIFPSYSWEQNAFEINYYDSEMSICLSSPANSDSLNLKTSENVTAKLKGLRKEYEALKKTGVDDYQRNSRAMIEFRTRHNYPSCLFVPAARSFYSTIREEIFSILSIDEKIDQILIQFGQFLEFEKRNYDRSYIQRIEGASKNPLPSYGRLDRLMQKIVGGGYRKINGRDFIVMPRGQIELSKASSGQQEAVPLLIALSRFPRAGNSLIIEEPEAHLFPSSQVEILNFIASQCRSSGSNIFFTTHSPYMLSALNNCILRSTKNIDVGISIKNVSAYAIINGTVESIVDKEIGIISAEYIDSVSDDINNEFSELMNVV